MRPLHAVLAVLVAVIWGIAFVVSKVGLETFTPTQLTALRFAVASVAVLWLPRPQVPWQMVLGIGLTTFTGQFLLQFFGIAMGMPAGLTAVVVQMQALFTVLFAAFFLSDRPSGQQVVGMLAAIVGLALIGLTLGTGATAVGFFLTLASALSWATGNVLVKQLPRTDMLKLMVWASLVPPLPAFALSVATDGPHALWHALAAATWTGLAAPVYLGLFASVLAYSVWGRLLQQYPAGIVAPFALLSPCVGTACSALVLGERFGPVRLAGMAAILVGVAVAVVPMRRLKAAAARR